MKRYIKYILISLAALSAASCIKEVLPVGGSQTQAQVSESKSAMMSMIKAIPASMTTSGTIGYASSYGDHTDFGIPGIHLRFEHMLEDMATMAENPFYNRFYPYDMNEAQGYQYTYCAYFWDAYYTWIRLVNDVILSIKPAVDEAGAADDEESVKLRDILGQAYAYRAMCYLDLARLYEPKKVDEKYYVIPDGILGLTVPIVDENTTLEQTKNNPRVNREKMYNFIIGDLNKAVELMDETDKTFSRPTTFAVYGMLARAYLELGYAEDPAFPSEDMFKKASEYARKVIDEGGFSPLTQTQWEDPVNGFNNAASNDAWIWGFSLVSENLSNLLTFVSHISSEASWGYARYAQFGVSARLYDQIPDSDFRKHSWLDPKKEEYYAYKFAGTEEDKQKFLTGMPAAKAYQSIKFRPAMSECSDFNIGNAADYCLMRIEEMYFIEVEAQARLKGVEEGKKLLKKFMTTYRDSKYSRNPGTMNDFMTEMLLQKRVEFWGEGILLFDYKRLGMGITRGYPGSNHAGVFKYNSDGRSPQWNIVITRAEFQSNTAINDSNNNPDPSGKLKLAQ